MTGRLAGLTAIVTGASSGIGHSIAERFVAEGATVFTASRSEASMAGATWVETDVTDPASVDALIKTVVDAAGRLDVIVNNAGVQIEKPIEDTTDDDFDLVMDVNVRGVFNGCRAAVRHMANQDGGGSIINIGSIAGAVADHHMAVYNASKGAVHALTRSIATDNGPQGVRATPSPRWIDGPRRCGLRPHRQSCRCAGRGNGSASRRPHGYAGRHRRTRRVPCVGRRRLRDR